MITEQTSNKLDQILTRSFEYEESNNGLFTSHIHFPNNDHETIVAITDLVINKLAHQFIKRTLNKDHLISLDALVQKSQHGEKIISLDRSGENPADMFRYLSTGNTSTAWLDRKGNVLGAVMNLNGEPFPVYSEKNVIPEKQADFASRYYIPIDKYIRKLGKKNNWKGFILVPTFPQFLINTNDKEIRDSFLKLSSFHCQDVRSQPSSFLNCEERPFILINANCDILSKTVKHRVHATHIINLIDLDKTFIRREPLKGFGRNGVVLHSKTTSNLTVLSFSDQNEIDTDEIEKINMTFMDVLPYDKADRSVIISKEDLSDRETDQKKPEIVWLKDQQITRLLYSIDDALRSTDNILHDILFNSWRFRKMLAFCLSEQIAKCVLDEINSGNCKMIPGFNGIGSHYLPDEHVQIIKGYLSKLISSIVTLYQRENLSIETSELIIVPEFIKENTQFTKRLPAMVSEKLVTASSASSFDKTIICEQLDPRQLCDEKLFHGHTPTIFWIEELYRPWYEKIRKWDLQKKIRCYDTEKHPLRSPLRAFELVNMNALKSELDSLTHQAREFNIDLFHLSDGEQINDQSRYRLMCDSYNITSYGNQRFLIKARNKWELFTVRKIQEDLKFDHHSPLELIDARTLQQDILNGGTSEGFNWRAKLMEKVNVLSFDTCYKEIETLSKKYNCRMVSVDWFRKDWLAYKEGNSIPNQKGLLLALGDFLSLDKGILKAMQIQKLNERLERAEVNRGLMSMVKDILNASEHLEESKHYEIAKRFTRDDHLRSSYNFFKKYISISESDDELIKELIVLISRTKKKSLSKKLIEISAI
jgi:hypothetical protein